MTEKIVRPGRGVPNLQQISSKVQTALKRLEQNENPWPSRMQGGDQKQHPLALRHVQCHHHQLHYLILRADMQTALVTELQLPQQAE